MSARTRLRGALVVVALLSAGLAAAPPAATAAAEPPDLAADAEARWRRYAASRSAACNPGSMRSRKRPEASLLISVISTRDISLMPGVGRRVPLDTFDDVSVES